MTFWILVALFALLAALWIAVPFLKRGAIEMNDNEAAISVFRDQRDELDRDLAQGMISAEEHAAAKNEIEQRALRAARNLDGGMSVSRRSLPVAAAVIAVCAGLAVASYAWFGAPGNADKPLAARKMEILEQRAAAGDLNSRISLLIERTSQNPESFEDWWTLGSSYASIGDYALAVEAFRRAAELGGDRPNVMAAYGEAMVLANGNKVPTAARVVFEQVLQSTPDPRARYYIALAKAQAQDFEGALDDWTALAEASEPDAPWMPLVRRDIVNMARFLKVDLVDYLPDATPREIAMATGATSDAAASSAARQIETALADDPMDYKAWIRLAELRAAQGEEDRAKAALDEARRHYAAAPFVLGKLDEAARALGLDLLDATAGTAGPTGEDIAAAADMTEEDRNAMVEGMVAGLAAKLEENPDNPDGWIMLVRSYSVLGKPDKAQSSYDEALMHFEGNEPVLARLKSEAGAMIREY